MAARVNWTRNELIVAFNLYCKIPFSKISHKHPLIIQLSKIIGRTPSAVAWKLANFASLDSSLKSRGIKGARNTGKMDEKIYEEFSNNWNDLVYESELLYSQYFNEEIIIETVEESIFEIREGKVRDALVKIRVNQSFFRKTILSSYDNKCCITGISITDFLVASHIVPWSIDEKNRLNPKNGICLNSIHDRAFDKGYISIDHEYKIIVSKCIGDFKENENFKKFFYDFEGQKIQLPKRFLPHKEFIEYHHQTIFKK